MENLGTQSHGELMQQSHQQSNGMEKTFCSKPWKELLDVSAADIGVGGLEEGEIGQKHENAVSLDSISEPLAPEQLPLAQYMMESTGLPFANILGMVRDIDARLRKLESEQKEAMKPHGAIGRKEAETPRSIMKIELLEMIFAAVSSGNSNYGVNRSYIRKVLAERFDVPITPYYMKRVNQVLQKAVDDGQLVLDPSHGLFTVNARQNATPLDREAVGLNKIE